jgi:hypothetical protein
MSVTDSHGVFIGPSSTRTLAALRVALLLIQTERLRAPHMADAGSRYITTAGEMTLDEIEHELRDLIDGADNPLAA